MNHCFTFFTAGWKKKKKKGNAHTVHKEMAKINTCVNVTVQQDFS